MPTEPFLQPILEDVDLEAQKDNLLDPKSYTYFTLEDWWKCSKIIGTLVLFLALIGLIMYIVFYTYKKN